MPVRPDQIWQLITDPTTLADLTPLVRSIEATGSQWRWALNGIEALGLKVEAVFSERMEFIEQRQITFRHDPSTGSRERAGVEGVYNLTPTGRNATDLQVDLTLSVDLPLLGMTRPEVERVILSTMRATGQRFASNLYEQLDLDPSTVSVIEVTPKRVPSDPLLKSPIRAFGPNRPPLWWPR